MTLLIGEASSDLWIKKYSERRNWGIMSMLRTDTKLRHFGVAVPVPHGGSPALFECQLARKFASHPHSTTPVASLYTALHLLQFLFEVLDTA